VTVTGQATTVDKRNASTAIATVSAEELTKVPAKSIEGNLAGKVVGATIFENSGVPGGGMQVQIRGATSILGQGDPLYVIDGVIVSNASVQGGLAAISRSTGTSVSSQDQTVNRLADINPNDIENIEVLKSAAATAIYGSRANERRRRHHDEARSRRSRPLQHHEPRRYTAGDAPPWLPSFREL
jgi:TonB-dependent SusC/RagA subfamily outer membrane receptor